MDYVVATIAYSFMSDTMRAYLDLMLDSMNQIGELYGVNPLYFAFLYFGTVPLFWFGVARLIHALRKDYSIIFPIVLITISQVPAYIYLFWAGNDLPAGAYVFAGILICTGIWRTQKHVRRSVRN